MSRFQLGSRVLPTRSLDESIVPLINVVFLLLIFFLVAGSMTKLAVEDIMPPHSTSSAEQGLDESGLSINTKGILFWQGEEIHADTFEKSLNEGTIKLPLRLQLHADAKVQAKDILPLMEVLKLYGVEQVRISTTMTSAN